MPLFLLTAKGRVRFACSVVNAFATASRPYQPFTDTPSAHRNFLYPLNSRKLRCAIRVRGYSCGRNFALPQTRWHRLGERNYISAKSNAVRFERGASKPVRAPPSAGRRRGSGTRVRLRAGRLRTRRSIRFPTAHSCASRYNQRYIRQSFRPYSRNLTNAEMVVQPVEF